MDESKKYAMNKYDRVMSRVYDRSRSSLKSTSFVTRHQTQSSIILGGKPSVSNVSSAVFSDLPVVLNDYKLDSFPEKAPRRPFVVKPRRTLKSLDPALSPPRSVRRSQEFRPRPRGVRSRESAPSVLAHGDDKWPESHMRQCHSSSSHTKLKDLKDEIKAYQNTEKLMHLRSQIFKSCGVVLDDTGQIAEDKAVQVEVATGQQAKVSWLKLRNCHRDALRRKEKTVTTRPWKYEREMEFLTQFMAIANKSTTNNVQDPLSDNDNSFEDRAPKRGNVRKKLKKTNSDINDIQAETSKKHEEEVYRDQNAPTVSAENDELYHFYMSMYNITKQLPLSRQIQIKRKVFNLVTAEQEQLLCRPTTALATEHYFEIKCEDEEDV